MAKLLVMFLWRLCGNTLPVNSPAGFHPLLVLYWVGSKVLREHTCIEYTHAQTLIILNSALLSLLHMNQCFNMYHTHSTGCNYTDAKVCGVVSSNWPNLILLEQWIDFTRLIKKYYMSDLMCISMSCSAYHLCMCINWNYRKLMLQIKSLY